MLKAGIVGLPNVGKSTLFNALLDREIAEASNYPFCTIEPNVGVVEVPDKRLETLADIVKTSKIVPAAVEFVDIAGLVEGAHKGEGLGNQFLSHIREVDAIIYVLRNFTDENITRAGSTNPKSDFQILLTELMLADLSVVQKQSQPKGNVTKEETIRWNALEKIRLSLENGNPVHTVTLDEKEANQIKSFNFLTQKPIIIVVNSDETTFANENFEVAGQLTLSLCAKLEAQLNSLPKEEKAEMLSLYGATEPALDSLIRKTYETLGLITFFTAGEKEARAWPIPNGTKAPQAAGTIHSDFETHFIKAKIASYDDFVNFKGWNGLKEAGKISMEGKDYAMQEGNVVEFMVNV